MSLVPGAGIEPAHLSVGDFESQEEVRIHAGLRPVSFRIWWLNSPSGKTKCGTRFRPAALATVGIQSTRLSNERAAHADTRAAHAQQLQRLEAAARESHTAALRATEQRIAVVAELDALHTKELSHALSENKTLRTAVRDGHRRLRIAATCAARPAGTDGVPGTAPAAGLDAAAADLSPDAGQAVLDLRAALITERAQLRALQDYARTCSAR